MKQEYWPSPDFEVNPIGALKKSNTWRDTVDDMLSVCHDVASDDPRESINRLIDWHMVVALDPSVSSDAQALVDKERQRCIDIIETYKIPIGNSRSGELACDWTYAALKEIRDKIKNSNLNSTA